MTRNEEVLATYTLQVIGVREPFPFDQPRLPHFLLKEIEENINDLINPPYHVEIKEWDAPGPGYVAAGMHWIRGRPPLDATGIPLDAEKGKTND